MISYSIDASVYAYPFSDSIPDPNEIYIYYKTIMDLYDILIKEQPRNKKFYLFFMDIVLLYYHKELNLLEQDISQLDKMLINANIPFTFNEAQKTLDTIITWLLTNRSDIDLDDDKLPEKIIFEDWFNIEDVKFKSGKELSLPEEVRREIKNEELFINTKKNIAKIAYLNEYVYKTDEFHNIILNSYIQTQPISADNCEFDIEMTKESFIDQNNIKQTKKYIIKNAPLINIKDQKQVNISKLDVLLNNNYRYNSSDWEIALNDAEKEFKYLKFGHDVKNSIREYQYKINIEKNNSYSSNDLKTIINWDKEGPDLLYEYLKTFNDFVSNADLSLTQPIIGERYHCNKICEFTESCSSNLRFYGVDCVPESRGIRDDRYNEDQFNLVEADRKIRNSKNGYNYSVYWTHLKPKTIKCYESLWFLTLRIHFMLLVTEQKIEIGWIGRHLYHPCTNLIKIKKCENDGRGIGCPLHPLNPLDPPYDKMADELTNYRRQWPKSEPEPENEPLKTEKPEKFSNILPKTC